MKAITYTSILLCLATATHAQDSLPEPEFFHSWSMNIRDASEFNRYGLAMVSWDEREYNVIDTNGLFLPIESFGIPQVFNLNMLWQSDNADVAYFPIKRDGRWGVLRNDGDEAIPCVYDSIAYDVNNSIYRMYYKGRWGAVNAAQGVESLEPLYDSVELFDDYIVGYNNNQKAFFSSNGDTLLPFGTYPDKSYLDGNLFITQRNGKWGALDAHSEMREHIPFVYDTVFTFSDRLAAVSRKGKWGYIDRRGKEIIGTSYDAADDFNNGFAFVQKGKKYAVFNREGTKITGFDYDAPGFFIFDHAVVKKDGKAGMINEAGETTVPFEYDDISFFNNRGVAIATRNDSAGLISIKGRVLIPLKYEKLHLLHVLTPKNARVPTAVAAERAQKYHLFRLNGARLDKDSFFSVNVEFPDKIIVGNELGTGVLDTLGKWVMPLQDDFTINEVDGYWFLGGKDTTSYIRDPKGNMKPTEKLRSNFGNSFHGGFVLNDNYGTNCVFLNRAGKPLYKGVQYAQYLYNGYTLLNYDDQISVVDSNNLIVVPPSPASITLLLRDSQALVLQSNKNKLPAQYNVWDLYRRETVFKEALTTQIYALSNGALYTQPARGMYCILDKTGKCALQTSYPMVLSNDYIQYTDHDGKKSIYGVCDKYGAKIIPAEYSSIAYEQGYFNAVTADYKRVLLDKNNKRVMPEAYNTIQAHEGIFIGKRSTQIDVFDSKTTKLQTLPFSNMTPFAQGKALASDNTGVLYVVDKTGAKLQKLPYRLNNSVLYDGQYIEVSEGDKNIIINTSGKVIASLGSNRLTRAENGFLVGGTYPEASVWDSLGKQLLRLPSYHSITTNRLGKAGVVQVITQGSLSLYNYKSALILQTPFEYNYPTYHEDCVVINDKKTGLAIINAAGVLIKLPQYTFKGYGDGLLCVSNSDGKTGYLDTNGKTAIPFVYTDATAFHRGLAMVKQGRRFALIKRP